MRICSDYRYRRAVWLVTCLILAHYSAFAQPHEYYQTQIAEKGYWRLSTNPDSRSTRILFFDRQNQLIYQETLAGNYIDLTQRTVDLLDDFLTRLERNQVLAVQIQSHLVPFPIVEKKRRLRADSELPFLQTDTSAFNAQNRIHCSVNSSGIIRLNLLNPSAEMLAIKLTDERGENVYVKSTNQKEYYSRLDVSALMGSHFQLSVSNEKGLVLYRYQLSKSTTVQFTMDDMTQDHSVSFVP